MSELQDQAREAVLAAIADLAEKATQARAGEVVEHFAAAARELAEAHAWLSAPSQPH